MPGFKVSCILTRFSSHHGCRDWLFELPYTSCQHEPFWQFHPSSLINKAFLSLFWFPILYCMEYRVWKSQASCRHCERGELLMLLCFSEHTITAKVTHYRTNSHRYSYYFLSKVLKSFLTSKACTCFYLFTTVPSTDHFFKVSPVVYIYLQQLQNAQRNLQCHNLGKE